MKIKSNCLELGVGWRLNEKLLFLVLCFLGSISVRAAIPEVFITESALRTVDSVELFRNGIYWWTSSACTETYNPGGASFRAFTDLRLVSDTAFDVDGTPSRTAGGFKPGTFQQDRNFLSGKPSLPKGILPPGCGYGPYVVRDDEAFYYARNGVIYRKPLTFAAESEGTSYPYFVGARLLHVAGNGVLWVSDTEIWYYAADLNANTATINRIPKTGATTVHPVLTLPGVSISKFTISNVRAANGTILKTLMIMLTPDGRLYQALIGGSAQLISNGVADFAIRDEAYADIEVGTGAQIMTHDTTLYYALGNPISYNGPGRLMAFSLNGSLGLNIEFDAGAGFRITSVAVDNSRIYLTRTPTSGQANSDLLRRNVPAIMNFSDVGDPTYSSITLQREFRSLRSTGQFVYFAHGNTVQRISAAAAPITIDFESFGIEVTQGMQNLNNSVSLVESKPVIVRGYARVLANNSGLENFDVPAQLRVFRFDLLGNPVEIPGSPFLPEQAPILRPIADLQTARTYLTNTYQFYVSPDQLKASRMRFQFNLNPGRPVPETAANPLANNSKSADLDVLKVIAPQLVFAVMSSTLPNYDPNAPNSGFWDIIARAKTLLPLNDFRVSLRSGSITKPKVTFTGVHGRSFDLPDDEDAALIWLAVARFLDTALDDFGGKHYIGMFPPGVTGFNGKGERPGNSLIVRMASDNPTGVDWNSVYGGRTLAHELGHNYGLKHIQGDASCNSKNPDGPFDVLPNGASGCTMGATDLNDVATGVGFDPISWTLVLPAVNGDLMSYATTRWTSEYNWTRLLDVFNAAAVIPPPNFIAAADKIRAKDVEQYLVVHATVDTDQNTGAFFPAHTIISTQLNPNILAELTEAAPADTTTHLQLVAADGSTLLDEAATIHARTDGPAGGLIHRALKLEPAAVAIRLLNNDTLLAELPISGNAPVVQLNAPVIEAGKVNISWTGLDADGDSLLYTLQFSPDDGQTWQTLAVNFPEESYSIDLGLVAGTEHGRIRVIVTDGVLTGMAVSDSFAVEKHAPISRMSGLANGQLIDFGNTLTVQGFGYDMEDGSLSSAALQWTLTGPQPKNGTGDTFALSNLAPGQYSLTLTVTDSDGQTQTKRIDFVVRGLAIQEGDEPFLDGLAGDAAYAKNPGIQLPYGVGMYASTRFAHANGALFVCISGIQYGANGTSASVGVRLDTLGALQGQATAAGFAVDENGGLYRMTGGNNGLTLVTNANVGYSVVILRDDNAWSAELRITDELLGGWNHSLGVAVVADDGNGATAPVTWPSVVDLNAPGTWSSSAAGPLPPISNDGNLLPYGDAEGLATTDGTSPPLLLGWTVTGNLSVVHWGADGGFPANADHGPDARGANFFTGGNGPESTATATIDVPYNPDSIDAGSVRADISGWLGGFGAQDDAVSLTFQMLDANGAVLDSFSIGPVKAADRSNATGLFYRENEKVLAAGTRKLKAILDFVLAEGTYNDAYADNLRLTLTDGIPFVLNERPTANAGDAQQIQTHAGGAQFTLDGSASYDPEGAPLHYIWSQTTPVAITVTGGDNAKPTITVGPVTTATILGFDLVIGDGIQESLPAHVQIILLPPVDGGSANAEILSGRFDGAAFLVQVSVTGTGQVQLERADELGASWNTVGSPATTTGGTLDLRDESPQSNHAFYRVKISP